MPSTPKTPTSSPAPTHGKERRRRPTASIVIPAWNAWEHTEACLESLRPTLGVRDEVIVVDNASTDATPRGLSGFAWVKVVSNDTNRGFAAACNQGAGLAGGEIVVFLNSDTVPVGRWLDELLAPFTDPEVVATGPRSNFVSGPQLVPDARYGSRRELRDFERRWREQRKGRTTGAERLVGFCLAVRKDAFDAVGGFDEGYAQGGYEDDDLCRRLSADGGKLMVADSSFVHHVGHASFDANGVDWRAAELAGLERFARSGQSEVKVSACMIVRDEEANLARCLASLAGVVDEIVVADTGSSDATIAIAEAHGAKVIQVEWEDDFAKARNAALAASSGDWVLSVDADEEWVGERSWVRDAARMAPPELEGWLVTITNELGRGVEARTNHPAVRLFRRSLTWSGRIHEQVVNPDRDLLVARPLPAGMIVHHGYREASLVGRDKLERNLRLATLALAEADGELQTARAELNLGRSLVALGRYDEAFPHLARATEGPEAPTARLALHSAARAALAASDHARAADLIAELRRRSPNPLLADILTGELAAAANCYDQAIEICSGLHLPALDEDGFLHQRSEIAGVVAACHRASGRPADALGTLLEALRGEGVCSEPLSTLAHDAKLSRVDPRQIGRALPAAGLESFAAEIVALDDADVALAILEGAWETHPGAQVVLAAGGLVAPRASATAAIAWAARLRQAGLGSNPLLAIADDASRTLAERVLAAAASTTEGLADDAAPEMLARLVPLATGASRDEVEQVLTALAPAYLHLLPPAVAVPNAPARVVSRTVSIVVPCWNRVEWTLQLLKSIQATTPDGTYELIIVDNGSTDATAAAKSVPDVGVKVVRNDTNRGFAVACNQGAEAANGETLVFVNNDVIVKPGWLAPLLDGLRRPRVGVVGSKLLFPDGTIQHAGVILLHDPDGQGYLDGNHLLYRQIAEHPMANRSRELRAVTAALMAVRRELFADLGGFDEGYLNGNEDVDFCLRAGEAGWRVLYEARSVAVHHESASGPERFKATTANRARLTMRWANRVIDERTTAGVVVVGPFGAGGTADETARALVELAENADIPVVTRPWPERNDGWAHRLGPGQSLVLSVLDPETTACWMESELDFGYLPAGVRVLAGIDELASLGLLEAERPRAERALRELCGSTKRSARSSWRAVCAD